MKKPDSGETPKEVVSENQLEKSVETKKDISDAEAEEDEGKKKKKKSVKEDPKDKGMYYKLVFYYSSGIYISIFVLHTI
jgi:hypothetical protein